eukprot:Lithocolla_globosa_v1_NODE_4875_length_1347_cov_23.923375.p3 type:complete len:136 gc:universal NODE_4875_length_1347_cov_23.923375:878-1285(+)
MTFTSGHGSNRLIEIFIVNEEWVNEIARSDNVFSDHGTDCRGFSVSARAGSLFIPYFTLVVAFQSRAISFSGVKSTFRINALHGLINGFQVGSASRGGRRRCLGSNRRESGSISSQKSKGNKSSVELHGQRTFSF